MPRQIKAAEIAIVIFLFIVINLVTAFRQKRITYDDGFAWERNYYTLATEFASHAPLAAQAPFAFRIGTPYLAALISPGDLVRGFRIVTIAGSFAISILLLYWFSAFIEHWQTRVLLVTLFLIQWDAPPRCVYHSPVHVDALYFVLVLLGLLAIRRYQMRPSLPLLGALMAICFVGVFFREIVMIVGVTLLAIHQPFSLSGPPEDRELNARMPPLRNWLPLVAGALAFLIVQRIVHKTNDASTHYTFLSTILDFFYTKPAIGYLQAWFLAFGPVLFIILFDWRNVRAFLAEHQYFLFFLATGAWLGYFGGTDTERLLYWSMPCVYVLLGRAIEKHLPVLTRWPVALTFILGQMMTSRILWTTPDYPTSYKHTFPILQQFGSHVQFLDLFSWDGFHEKELLSIAQFAIYGAAILYSMRRLERRDRLKGFAKNSKGA